MGPKYATPNFSEARRALLIGGAAAGLTVSFGRLFSTPASAATGGTLQVMAWEGYDLTNELKTWREENGVTVETTSIASQDDVHTKFIAGNPPPLDLAEYNQAYSELYIDQIKIVSPLDVSKIPNYNADNLFSVFFDKPTWFKDGTLYGSPYIWGFNTLLYNSAEMEEPKYPALTKDELKTAFDGFVAFRDQARLIAINQGDVANFIASKEVLAVVVADPQIIQQVTAQGVPLKMAVPEEGPVLWVDAWFIPVSADNVETAHAFINQSLDPQVQANVCMSIHQAPVSKKAVELLDEAARQRIDYSKIDQIFSAGLPGIPPVEAEGEVASYDDWIQAWQQFKAGM